METVWLLALAVAAVVAAVVFTFVFVKRGTPYQPRRDEPPTPES